MKKRAMRLNAYAVISRAVEEGVSYGYQRAHKHTSKPDADTIKGAVELAVMNALSEVIDFEGSE